jgi:hypothetical protein
MGRLMFRHETVYLKKSDYIYFIIVFILGLDFVKTTFELFTNVTCGLHFKPMTIEGSVRLTSSLR